MTTVSNDIFYYFNTNLDCEDLLKKEVELFFPELRLSYSRPCFLTFKGSTQVRERVFNRQWYFARRAGESLERTNSEQIEGKIKDWVNKGEFGKAHIWNANLTQYKSTDLPQIPELDSQSDMILDIIKVRTDEFWLGQHRAAKALSPFAGGDPQIQIPENSSSRAYLKWAEIFAHFPELSKVKATIVELGAAPGGGSQFLVEESFKVIAVDPGLMKYEGAEYLQMSVQDISRNTISRPDSVIGMAVDMNLSPLQSAKETLRVQSYFPELKWIIINLKMTKVELIDAIRKIERQFRDSLFPHIHFLSLPSHKREVMLIAFRD